MIKDYVSESWTKRNRKEAINKFNNLLNTFFKGEPWCSLRTGQDLKSWSKNEEIAWNQVHRQTEKYKFYIKAFDL